MLGLFAVYLGGRAAGCRTELHDVVFALGDRIEDCHEQLLDAWFGLPDGLHVDSWQKLDCVDGHWVSLVPKAAMPAIQKGEPRLFFVNMGGYEPGRFMEFHAAFFLIAASKQEVKDRARALLGTQMQLLPHADDMIDIDDCLQIDSVGDYGILVQPSPGVKESIPTNGYFPLPRETIAAWKKKRAVAA